MKAKILRSGLLLLAIFPALCTLNAETRFDLGNSQPHKISVSSFSSLSVSHPVNVTYVPTSSEKSEITVVSKKPYKGDVVINNSGGKLSIELELPYKNNLNYNDLDVQITVKGPVIKSISASLGAQVNVTSAMSVASFSATAAAGGSIKMTGLNVKGELELETSSGGSFSLKENSSAGELDLDCSSGSTINISGTLSAKDTEIDVSSASTVIINSLNSPTVEIDASSAAKVNIENITASNIDIDASSASSVTVSGTTKKVKGEATSTAKINLRELKHVSIRTSEDSYGKVSY